METNIKVCPKCRREIKPGAPEGLCPVCLLDEVSKPTVAGEGTARGAWEPPTLEELRVAFPQLEILELIGRGGMGCVFRARQPKLDRLVALKILPQRLGADPAFAERFVQEGRVLARLNHPNIVTVHDFGQVNGLFYLVMEHVDGVNLREAMRVGKFTPDQALAIVPRICDGLEFAHHEGILHRDIKPENILLDARGRVKIADFGIAKILGKELEQVSQVIGTPHYMAPEQVENPRKVDRRADVYALGVVLYEMLTGELPLGRFAPPSERSQADARIDQVVLRALEKEPERRTSSAGEMKTQVEAITGSGASPLLPGNRTAADAAPKRPGGQWRKHFRAGFAGSAVVFACCLITSLLLAMLLPNLYLAVARISFEQPTDGKFDPYLAQIYSERLKSPELLHVVVSRTGLQRRWSERYRRQLTMDQVLERLRESIEVRQSRNTGLLEIRAYSDLAPEAAHVANSLADVVTSQGKQRFELVDSALIPHKPVRPNRPFIVAAGALGGLAAGFFAGLLAAALSYFGFLPEPNPEHLRRWRRNALWLLLAIVLAAAVVNWIMLRRTPASSTNTPRLPTTAPAAASHNKELIQTKPQSPDSTLTNFPSGDPQGFLYLGRIELPETTKPTNAAAGPAATNAPDPINDLMAQLILKEAEARLVEVRKQFEVGLAGPLDYAQAEAARDIAAAQLRNDPLAVAKIKLNLAENVLQVTKRKFDVGAASKRELESAQAARHLEALRLQQLTERPQ